MTSPRSSLSFTANSLFNLIVDAERAGYRLEVDEYGHLDLVDNKTGEREPITTVFKEED